MAKKVADSVQYMIYGVPVAGFVTGVNADGTLNMWIFGSDWSDIKLNVPEGTVDETWREIQ